MHVLDERRNHAGESGLLDRLPASYRERPGALEALLDAVAMSLRTFRAELEHTEDLLGAHGAQNPVPRWGADLFGGVPGSGVRPASSRRLLPRTIDLCRWIARVTGADPCVWTGVKLERSTDGARSGNLIVRAAAEHSVAPRAFDGAVSARACVIAWSCDRSDPVSIDELRRRLTMIPSDLRPVGVELQCARFYGEIPSNPYVSGLCLQGELLQVWA